MLPYAFGQQVSFSHVYVRAMKMIDDKNGNKWAIPWKIWEKWPYSTGHGLFLGVRTLSNGTREFWEDEGYTFIPKEYFRVALICPSTTKNPVYVPLDCIKV